MHYIVMEITFFGHGKSWKNHGIVFLNFCGNNAKFGGILFCKQYRSRSGSTLFSTLLL